MNNLLLICSQFENEQFYMLNVVKREYCNDIFLMYFSLHGKYEKRIHFSPFECKNNKTSKYFYCFTKNYDDVIFLFISLIGIRYDIKSIGISAIYFT